jgi:hypothetical protein
MVICKCGFKTFNSSLPGQKGSSVNVPQQPPADAGWSAHRWGIFKWPQVGEFGWPPGALGAHAASASTAYGDLNNFDVVNDTGQECHGFEIEIEDVRSTDITYTYDWNHYGAPKIREDLSDPAHPKVFVRYQSAKDPDGNWVACTAMPAAPLTPTDGHSCTNPAVNDGCEHFAWATTAPRRPSATTG